MAERVAYLEAVFGADITAFRRGTTQVRRELNLLSDVAGGLSRIGRDMTLMLSTPLVALGGAAVKVAGDFEASMRNVNSILFASEAELANLSSATLDFGATLRSGPVAAADALYAVVSAGFTDMESAMMVSQAAAQAAEAGLADLETTSEALSAAMLAYGANANDAAHFSDVLTRAVQVGVGEMESFAGSIGLMVSSGVGLGVTFDELAATQAFLTQRGLSASRAATSLNMAMVALMKPTEDMSAAFSQLGVRSGEELIQTFGGIQGAFEALQTVFGTDTAAITQAFGREQGARVARTLLNDLEAYGSAMEEFRDDVVGATGRALEEQYKSFPAMLERLGSAAAAAGVAIGDKLIPFLRPAVEGFRQLLLSVQDVPDEFLFFGIAVAGAVAAAGPLIWILGSILSPVGLLAAGVAGLGAAVAFNFGGARDAIVNFANTVLGPLTGVKDAITEFWQVLSGTTPEDPMQTVDSSGLVQGLTVALEQGQTVWDAWVAQGGESGTMTWTEFRTAFEAAANGTPLNLLQPGTYTVGGAGTNDALAGVRQSIHDALVFDQPESSLGDRLSAAVTAAWPMMQEALNGIANNVKTWFSNTFLPSFDAIGSDVLDAIAGIFAPQQMGISGPLDQAEQWMLSSNPNNIVESIKRFFSDTILTGLLGVGSEVTSNLPGITSSIQNLFSTVGTWIVDTGLPTLSYSIGYLAGSIGGLIVQAIQGLGQGGGGDLGQGISDTIISPLEDGFAAASADMGMEGFGEQLASKLTIVLMGVVPLLVSHLGAAGFMTGMATTIFGLLSKGLVGGFNLIASADTLIAPLITRVGSLITTAFTALANTNAVVGVRLAIMGLMSKASAGLSAAGGALSGIGTSIWGAVSGALATAGSAVTGALTAALGTTVGMAAAGLGVIYLAGKFMFETEAGQNLGNALRGLVDSVVGDPTFMTEVNRSFEDWLAGAIYNVGTVVAPDSDFVQNFGEIYGMGGDGTAPIELGAVIVPAEDADAQMQTMAQNAGMTFNEGFNSMLLSEENGFQTVLRTTLGPDGEIMGYIDTINQNGIPVLRTGFTGLSTDINDAALNAGIMETALMDHAAALEISYSNLLDGFLTDIGRARDELLTLGAMVDGLGPVNATPTPIDGARAGGGSVLPGKNYLVGENGPELLRMGSSGGTITPNALMQNRGGGTTVVQNTIMVDGAQDVDALLYQLERRGIYLQ